ncbi:MAG TPA: 50S ribosomal protein L10 [Candidatus Binatia bacterium]|nr:50S ribosomal protein L10 [Candidatus Binatia bacterium]
MDRREKEQTIVGLQQCFATATSAVLTGYRGLTVAELNTLRRELREVAGEYRVAKNTLIELAVEGTPYLSFKTLLAGQNGLVFGYGDVIGLARVVTRYAREHNKFTLRGGVTDGQFLAAAEMEAIATLPNREVLRAQLLGLLSRPATQLVNLLTVPAARVTRILDARKTQLSIT